MRRGLQASQPRARRRGPRAPPCRARHRRGRCPCRMPLDRTREGTPRARTGATGRGWAAAVVSACIIYYGPLRGCWGRRKEELLWSACFLMIYLWRHRGCSVVAAQPHSVRCVKRHTARAAGAVHFRGRSPGPGLPPPPPPRCCCHRGGVSGAMPLNVLTPETAQTPRRPRQRPPFSPLRGENHHTHAASQHTLIASSHAAALARTRSA